MKIIIPTKGRADVIGKKSLQLFPDATLCIGDDETDAYAKVSDRLLVHPANVVGMGPLRQWILDHVPDKCLVMADDDITRVYSQVGFHKRRITDPAEVAAIIERVAILAGDMGCSVFGFAQGAKSMVHFNCNCRPFHLNLWVGTVLGVIGRRLRFDTSVVLHDDIDFCLQALLDDRIVLCDCRYYFAHAYLKLGGGLAALRSGERKEREIAYLRRKWGRCLDVVQAKGTTRLVVRVVR